MATAKTNRWKMNERQTVDLLQKFLIPAKRITRSGNYQESVHDVDIIDHPRFKLDAKYSISGFASNRLLETVRTKYCPLKEDVPIILQKGYREIGQKAVVDAEFLFLLMSFYLGYGTKEELEAIYYKLPTQEDSPKKQRKLTEQDV